ncbi:CGNR zinc finger domain-containing protein [Glutamicibacter sp. JL.03c]|uniref:CGNR zinc finger domain-containing protein n=1 Tax=Glutamicibacter sp. JL.03c TaxID=2984842 RepID=UPI0021F78F9E|nr:CGNR zinc finger domain-containing protein [Glutamicibacter sp. JL.03c]UYQ77499.1 CGNR zinc finger domain-containing protein [Glutamicibacter sp. JL.03c]
MPLDNDTGESLTAAAWLSNTAGEKEGLADIGQLVDFYDRYDFTGRFERTEHELQSVREIRPVIRRMLLSDRDEAPGVINEILLSRHAIPQLNKHGQRDWHIHAVGPQASFEDRILVEIALAMSIAVIADETSRISTCQATQCENIVVDLTRNRSRRFCSVQCGNRMAVSAFRKRQTQ